MEILKVKRITKDAIIPKKAFSNEAGFDLYAAESNKIYPSERQLILTNIALQIPAGYYGQIFDRSGNAYKKGMHTMAGVIDSSYRGDIGVVLYNTNKEDIIEINKGDKIAQLVILPIPEIKLIEDNDLDKSDRGTNGFGSTGR